MGERITTKRALLAGCSLLVLGAIGMAAYGPHPQATGQPGGSSEIIWDMGFDNYNGPVNASSQQIRDFMDARVRGNPLPPGFTLVSSEGRVTCVLTGQVKLNGQLRARVTLTDDIEDIDEAYVYVDEQLVSTATRANGKIEDLENGFAEATMGFWMPLDIYSMNVEVRWIADDGTVLRQNVAVGS